LAMFFEEVPETPNNYFCKIGCLWCHLKQTSHPNLNRELSS
jgi:hypothetical protein